MKLQHAEDNSVKLQKNIFHPVQVDVKLASASTYRCRFFTLRAIPEGNYLRIRRMDSSTRMTDI